jgi:hypothetical protein
MTRRLAIAIAFVSGIFMIVESFLKAEPIPTLREKLFDYNQIIFAMTMMAGGITLFRKHLENAIRSSESGVYSLVTIVAILFMVIGALVYGTGVNSPYYWAFHNMQAPMQASVFALLAFFVASAAYRGFRVRSKTAAVLAAAALLVLLGRNAFGEMLSDWLPQAAGWVLNHPSVAAKRGILIGIGLGSVATALRVILGIERTYL